MERIPSFSVDHTNLQKGMYISRIDAPDIITYDLRMKRPNKGDYLSTGGMHTLEHIFATYARNGAYKDSVIYVGPMGCRTGFYLITRGLPHTDAIRLVQEAMDFVATFEGDIPGASAPECGNYADQNLPEARAVAADMALVLQGWTEDALAY
ncbi:MAG: S-ribosylhomocysteine lyase [Oscillospiraceae bacterium]